MSLETAAPPVLATQPSYYRVSARPETETPPLEEVTSQYHLGDLVQEIKEKEYKRIALQFPDGLLPHSTVVASALTEELKKNGIEDHVLVFVLGDTSYSECCVDEIAAQHVNADVVVHIGVACLNPVVHSPVIYLFGQGKLNLDLCVQIFKEKIPDTSSHVIIVAETPYQVYVDQLKERLAEYANTLTTVPILSSLTSPDPSAPSETIIPGSLTYSTSTTHTEVSAIPHRAHPQLQTDLQSYILFHLGVPPPPAQLHLSTLFSTPPIIIDPESPLREASGTVSLARRYKTMMSARAASTIGILVNTLSLRSSSELIMSLQQLIRDAGKKHYVVAVGKPNVAKLANFDVVDVWVVVGCARGGMIIDREGEYFKPLVTPFELKLALKRDIVWGAGEWILEFDKVMSLKDDMDDEEKDQGDEAGDDEDAAPEFDAVTGRYVASRPLSTAKSARKPHIDVEIENSDVGVTATGNSKVSSQLVSGRGNASQLATRGSQHYSTAGAFLQSKRFWKGLGSDFADDDFSSEDNSGTGERRQGAKLEVGRKGIARGYVNGDV
ncbi:putative diphthamide synthesis protein-domain-containing protein [Lipomyces orientalis]|uniref:Diphthamide synthesis protein-domain-containing protein n=1 Tax=Lipomyces orientalis TaxID=1233043 RepID=A0ACC3TRS0_9ASCO